MVEKILQTSKYVSDNSSYVSIDKEKIKELIIANNFKTIKHWLASNPCCILDLKVDEIINFLIIFDSIDCSFWGHPKWTIETEVGQLDGAFALMYSLLKLRNEHEDLNFEKITYEEFSKALQGNVEIPLLKERYHIVKQVSKIINDRMEGNFYEYIKDIVNDEKLFEIIINNFPSFTDTRNYQDKEIYFYKLAQLLVSDILHIRELKESITVDYSHLVGCADYKIPQVLRNLGVLVYNAELSDLVDNGIMLDENSTYEVEIRANMIIALYEIKQALNDNISLININDIIWLLGQNKANNSKPYHLTRTLSY